MIARFIVMLIRISLPLGQWLWYKDCLALMKKCYVNETSICYCSELCSIYSSAV